MLSIDYGDSKSKVTSGRHCYEPDKTKGRALGSQGAGCSSEVSGNEFSGIYFNEELVGRTW